MRNRPLASEQVFKFLWDEMEHWQAAVEMYKLLEETFQIQASTKLVVLDFNELRRKNEFEKEANPERYWARFEEAQKRVESGDSQGDVVNFEKVELEDTRYPDENRGWTFYMGYSEKRDTLFVKAVGLP